MVLKASWESYQDGSVTNSDNKLSNLKSWVHAAQVNWILVNRLRRSKNKKLECMSSSSLWTATLLRRCLLGTDKNRISDRNSKSQTCFLKSLVLIWNTTVHILVLCLWVTVSTYHIGQSLYALHGHSFDFVTL